MIMSRALHKRQASRYLSIYKSCYLDIGSHQAPVGLQKIDGSVCQNKRRTELSNALYVPATRVADHGKMYNQLVSDDYQSFSP